MASLIIPDLCGMRLVGQKVAQTVAKIGFPPIFLYGPLGAGKTTFAAAVVQSLPGGCEAEVSSPSFTIYNLYPTSPPVMHCDLYRCRGQLPEDILEFIDASHGLLMVEWAEFFREPPSLRLDISFNVVNDKRLVNISGNADFVAFLEQALSDFLKMEDAPLGGK